MAKRKRNQRTKSTHNLCLASQIKDAVAKDSVESKLRAELQALKSKYKHALEQIKVAEEAKKKAQDLADIKIKKFARKRRNKKKPSATAILVCSDWHSEERIVPEDCRNMNEFNLEIADQRIKTLVDKASMLIEHESHLANIDRIVVAALGDFITGHIHDDCIERTQLAPLAAARWAGERLNGVIDRMQEIAPVLVVTATGNHGRTTRKPRVSTENEHSYEQNLYLTMASAERRPGVTWKVGRGYHNIVDLDGFILRAHHGHSLSGGGGIGGLSSPANRAISKWNVAQKADLDIFGHFHQFLHIPYRFVCNGSLCGHNAFADRIRAEFQPASQSLVVLDHEHNRVTKVLPVFVQ